VFLRRVNAEVRIALFPKIL